MRSYSALIVFEGVLDTMGTSDVDLTSFANTVFSPTVQVVETNCGTTLGYKRAVTYEIEGNVELATGVPISKDRIDQLLASGVYQVKTRTLHTCISQGGVCATCAAAHQNTSVLPSVGALVQVLPVYEVAAEVVVVPANATSVTLITSPDVYTEARVYSNGVHLTSGYSISGTTFTPPVSSSMKQYAIRYFTSTRAPFLGWLASTYSGSLLGLKPLPSQPLPIRTLLLSSLIQGSVLTQLVANVPSTSAIPEDMLRYLSQIQSPLEKALFLLTLRAIYDNATG